MSWRIAHVDLQGAAPEVPAGPDPVYAVFWWGALPLGFRWFAAEELPIGRARLISVGAGLIAEQLATRLPGLGSISRAGADGRPQPAPSSVPLQAAWTDLDALDALAGPAPDPADQLAVVVCTRDRLPTLAGCLASLSAQRSPPAEIVVVDNSPEATAAGMCAKFDGVRHVHEPRPGLSRARNTGIDACAAPLIAFTDDDVEVDPGWTAEIVRAFRSLERVDVVTGLVLPASLDTAPQRFFQFDLGGFGSGFVPMVFDRTWMEDAATLGPQVWRIGAGANMAFRREVFDRVGPFDERLGAGAAGCSEDSELWYRVIAGGGRCLYEPRAVVHHHHRAGWAELRGQIGLYMRGHVAALVAQYDLHGHRGNLRRIVVQLPRHFVRSAGRAVRNGSRDELRLVGGQVRGWAGGVALAFRPGWRRGGKGRGGDRERLGAFLAANPYPEPLTGGLFYREKMRAIHRIAPERLPSGSGPSRVLEIGGGRSGLASLLYPGASITNIDLDFSLLGQGPGASRYRYVCGDACRLPFADDSFDAVTLFDVLEHVPDDARAAAEALRVTRPGGWVLISTPDAAWRYPYYEFMRRWCPPETQLTEEWGHVRRGYTTDALAALFGTAPRRSATFVNAATAFYHDVGFSRIGRRRRRLLYGLAAPVTLAGYVLHRPDTPGTETALAWQRE